jgi:hypothetical protein
MIFPSLERAQQNLIAVFRSAKRGAHAEGLGSDLAHNTFA